MESLIFRPSITSVNSLILGWPYNGNGELRAYLVDIYRSPSDIITYTSTREVLFSKVLYPYCLNAVVRGEQGVLIRHDRDRYSNCLSQMWWIPYGSRYNFQLRTEDLGMKGLGVEQTGELYRIVVTPEFYILEVYFHRELGTWIHNNVLNCLESGTPVAPTDYYLGPELIDKKNFYPRVFVDYTTMHMFVMNYEVRLVPDFKGRVPAYYTILGTPVSETQV